MGGWTFDDYQRSPPEVIDAVVRRMNKDYEFYGVTSGVRYVVQVVPKD